MVDSHSVDATVAFLEVLQEERSIGRMQMGSCSVWHVDGQVVPLIQQDGVGSSAIEVLPPYGVDERDVKRPRKQH